MKITKELLIEKGARCEGLQQFARFFPSGFDGEWTRELQIKILTKTRLRRHFGWAVDAGVVPMWGMNGANLAGANLAGAGLAGANLYRASLDGANLAGASLAGVNLYRASLDGANLAGASLDGANLYRANLAGAWYTKETIFPKDFDSKAAGMVLEE